MARTLDPASLSVPELRERLAARKGPVPARLLGLLAEDPRKGVRPLYEALRRRSEAERERRRRLDAMQHFERILWKAGLRRVAGVDEVGVGPLAGPVVAAAVVFPPGTEIDGVDDSKKLEPGERERLDLAIRERASGIGLGVVGVAEIDRMNVYHASLEAMRLAVAALPFRPEHVLVDARTVPGLEVPQNRFDRGDGIDFSIAAASIVAKVHRDRLMVELDRLHPGYGFASNKGYGTAEHQAAIRRLGPSPVHRSSYRYLKELCGGYGERFYACQRRLAEARTARELAALGREIAAEPTLSDDERHKLKLTLRRRFRALV